MKSHSSNLSEMVSSVRTQFPIFERKVYLNSCSQGALSTAVEAGLLDHIASWHEGGSPWDLWVQKYEEARRVFARLIGAEPDEVAIVASASAGANGVASALTFRERPKVVLGEFEFPTMGHIWLAQERRGAQVNFVAAEDGRLGLEAYERAIDQHTGIVPLTQVCFLNGFRSDVAGVVRLAHQRGALVLLDGYQDCGTRPLDVKALDVDFYVSGTLKYLLGAAGVAFLYVRRDLVRSLVPTITGWFGQTNPFSFDARHLDPAPAARRFESGTPPIINLYAAMPGIELLLDTGLEAVASHVASLARLLVEGARQLRVRVKTPGDTVGPLVVLQARDLDEMLRRLDARGIIASGRYDGLRISFHVYNTPGDVEQVLQALEDNLDLMVREE
ncbi:MAG TPA: aminotransferase class V-fold PLP-dependent enzyme [Candidatus Acidoferrales bacterium]|nr:aminotransferase class V-fold PLP-dependent enzyme [Candidatus Acidoferrales bacterium]